MKDLTDILLNYVCPSAGVLMSTLLYAAPVRDLRRALRTGRLGPLNTAPWTVMMGNTVGWTAYGCFIHDPFVVASNIPGLILSIWLNMGAAKLQYLQLSSVSSSGNVVLDPPDHSLLFQEEQGGGDEENNADGDNDNSPATEPPPPSSTPPNNLQARTPTDQLAVVPQESLLLKILIFWISVLLWVGWAVEPGRQARIVGVLVNINLVFFYGAPLQTMKQVLQDQCSDSIHAPTMVMNWINTSFWIAYGYAQHDLVILAPNAIGLCLGLVQGVLCLLYPRKTMNETSIVIDTEPLLQDDDEEGRPTETSRSAEISFV